MLYPLDPVLFDRIWYGKQQGDKYLDTTLTPRETFHDPLARASYWRFNYEQINTMYLVFIALLY